MNLSILSQLAGNHLDGFSGVHKSFVLQSICTVWMCMGGLKERNYESHRGGGNENDMHNVTS